MAGDQITVAVTRFEEGQKGYNGISLTNFASQTLEPQIAQGSIVEISGALYEFSADETITGFSGLSNSTTAYLELTVSGATVSAAWGTSTPTWDDDKQGFYTSAKRVVGGLFKDGSGDPTNKWLYASWARSQQVGLKVLGTGELVIPADLTMDGSAPQIHANEPIEVTAGLKPSGRFVDTSNPTQDQVYDFLSPFLPSVGDIVRLAGVGGSVASGDVVSFHFMEAERTSGTAIRLRYVQLDDFGTLINADQSTTVNDGNSGVLTQQIQLIVV